MEQSGNFADRWCHTKNPVGTTITKDSMTITNTSTMMNFRSHAAQELDIRLNILDKQVSQNLPIWEAYCNDKAPTFSAWMLGGSAAHKTSSPQLRICKYPYSSETVLVSVQNRELSSCTSLHLPFNTLAKEKERIEPMPILLRSSRLSENSPQSQQKSHPKKKHKQIQRFIHAILAQKTEILWSEHTRTIVTRRIQFTCMCVNLRLYRSPKQPKLKCKKRKYAIRYLHVACTNLLVELWRVFFLGVGAKNPRPRNRVFSLQKSSRPLATLAKWNIQSEIWIFLARNAGPMVRKSARLDTRLLQVARL
jgi:hypothetical protein